MQDGEASSPAFIFPQPSESVHALPPERPHELIETPSSSHLQLIQYRLSMLRLDLHSRLLNRTGASSWHDIAAVVRPGKGPRRKRRILPPTPTYQPHEGQQYMLFPTTCPISSPISFTERTPLLLSSPQVAH